MYSNEKTDNMESSKKKKNSAEEDCALINQSKDRSLIGPFLEQR